MAAVVSAAARQVAASVAGNGGPWPWSDGTLANERIAGFTKMMYAITMNVVRPAITSEPKVVRCSRSLKTASSIAAPPSVRPRSGLGPASVRPRFGLGSARWLRGLGLGGLLLGRVEGHHPAGVAGPRLHPASQGEEAGVGDHAVGGPHREPGDVPGPEERL